MSSARLQRRHPAIGVNVVKAKDVTSHFIPRSTGIGDTIVMSTCGPGGKRGVDFYGGCDVPIVTRDLGRLCSGYGTMCVTSPRCARCRCTGSTLGTNGRILYRAPFIFDGTRTRRLCRVTRSGGLILVMTLGATCAPTFDRLFSVLGSHVVNSVIRMGTDIAALASRGSSGLGDGRLNNDVDRGTYFPLLPVFGFLKARFQSIDFCSGVGGGISVFAGMVFHFSRTITDFRINLNMGARNTVAVTKAGKCICIPTP